VYERNPGFGATVTRRCGPLNTPEPPGRLPGSVLKKRAANRNRARPGQTGNGGASTLFALVSRPTRPRDAALDELQQMVVIDSGAFTLTGCGY